MNRQARRAMRSKFVTEQTAQPERLTLVPADEWPAGAVESQAGSPARPVEVWRSRKCLVVLYTDGGFVRMTVNRTSLGHRGWADEITWDELQQIKREIGRPEQWAVEVFPADSELVNVANMRHLWLLDAAPDFAWQRFR